MIAGDPYVRCSSNPSNPCFNDPCGVNAYCEPLGRSRLVCLCEPGYTGNPYAWCSDYSDYNDSDNFNNSTGFNNSTNFNNSTEQDFDPDYYNYDYD